MRTSRLRAKLRKLRQHAADAEQESGELNVVPYLDIVINVIMFMLASSTFAAELADIQVRLPPVPTDEQTQETPMFRFNLSVTVTEKGFTLASADSILHRGYTLGPGGRIIDASNELPTLVKRDRYPFEELTEKVRALRTVAPDETTVIVNADENVPYEVLVQTLDACRGRRVIESRPDGRKIERHEGFDDVVLSTGVTP